ncbi:uncharacterized protein BX663DRAFT_458225 [Cokeromyces recurvatus]|uniref:uncharacterized protein n=1 Tax=Cokeromyces recurvatus TaxID=90255 RepID=UPI00222050A2|nr:uncharacterized protein BX663DRAFT_458225 [Cokeromyces recurvatus]KAI7900574.1 hypothetical protein BX663DRAFT_458225 [Cokeromyces recurvatus]
MAGKGVVRSIKNIAKGFSEIQIKVREATSNDPWGPSGTLMNEIAQYTYNEGDFIEIMDMIDKRLNDKGKNWRHVFKALLLLDYCLHVGSENVVLYAKENIYIVKTLREFQHVDEHKKDVGANVRQKAKDITNLLQDDNRLKEERRQRKGMRDRMANVGNYYLHETAQYSVNEQNKEDEDLKRALEESKLTAAAEEEKKRHRQEQEDLAKAIQLSEEEALKEKKKENTNHHNPYQQSDLQLDWTTTTTTTIHQQPNNPYQPYFSQPPQLTGFIKPEPHLLTNQQLSHPLFTTPTQDQPLSYTNNNFFTQQEPSSQSMQFFTYQQQSPSFFHPNPFSTTNNTNTTITTLSATMTEPQRTYDYSGLVFGNNDSSTIQQSQSPFFTNNHLPSFFSTSSTARSPVISSSPIIAHTNPKQPSMNDLKYAKINALLTPNRDDGIDTFGNQGSLRIPYGSGFANSISLLNDQITNKTKNPFGHQ